jgi:beta-mannanase
MPDRSHARRKDRKTGRTRLRVWGAANLAILAVVTGWVLHNAEQTRAHAVAATSSSGALLPGDDASTAAAASARATGSAAPAAPTKAQLLASTAKYFGVSAEHIPWSASTFQTIAKTAGVSPDMVEYYVNWKAGFDRTAVLDAYAEGAIPLITWEPFAGLAGSQAADVNQSAYSLATVIDGAHDAYIKSFATAVQAAKVPVVLRFAHEMNGDWYPWSEGVNGNTPGQYAQAWRHIWTIFQQVGATNVIWDWAPNILRGATNTDLAELYPGDAYVDWVGVTGYEDHETTPQSLFDPTLQSIRAFTAKPLLISETGAQPGSRKAEFTSNFLAWLRGQKDVVGFVWSEMTTSQGAGADWGFDADSGTLAVFRVGIQNVPLMKVPAS